MVTSTSLISICGEKGPYAHELGHNLGMLHAWTLTMEYGDGSDPMGISSAWLPGFNAPHRHEMGWLGGSHIQNITQGGLYNVAPLAIDPSLAATPQAIVFPKPDTGDYYYVSYRAPQGFDNYLDFQITFDCAHAVPSLSISPQGQSGAPGSRLSYSVSLRNGDPAACPASTFALGAAPSAGWVATLSPANVMLAPGGTGQATLTVTSPPTALARTYGATVNVTDVLTALHTASSNATYSVKAPDNC